MIGFLYIFLWIAIIIAASLFFCICFKQQDDVNDLEASGKKKKGMFVFFLLLFSTIIIELFAFHYLPRHKDKWAQEVEKNKKKFLERRAKERGRQWEQLQDEDFRNLKDDVQTGEDDQSMTID